MSYQALLFCPDDKTARTVMQVLSDLEFTVEPCSEPFAAVKKLMVERFDAIVVDCDNEQNATLLFKSARNSTSNQASLAVAVVEGQAGVAKAFRIGANLVLTKPINVDQAKGTLRVARGLLRKGDAAKPAASPTAPAPATPVVVSEPPKPVAAAPGLPKLVPPTSGPSTLPPRPVPAQPAMTARLTKPAQPAADDDDSDVLEISAASETPSAVSNAPTSAAMAPTITPVVAKKPAANTISFSISSGAASAPAPARIIEKPVPEAPAEKLPAPAAERAEPAEASVRTDAGPSFTFGGNAEPASSGGGKKALIAVAAVVIVAAGSYFGWTQFKVKSHAVTQNSISPVAPAAASQPVAPSSSAAATPTATATTASETSHTETPVKGESKAPEKSGEKPSEKSSKSATNTTTKVEQEVAVETKPVSPALVVKSGSEPKTTKSTADTAPPVVAMAGGGSLPNLTEDTNTTAPRLQHLSVSQGVSQGLIVKKVAPNYPSSALRMHVEGPVELLATIAKSGSITSVKVISGEPMLAQAALDAVKQWKYRPYLLNGEPVEIQTQITINFKLPK